MNSASPLIPQGSNLEQQSKARSSLKVKIFCAIGVNVAVLLVLLMQGCKREQPQPPVENVDPYNTAVFTESNAPALGADTNLAPAVTDPYATTYQQPQAQPTVTPEIPVAQPIPQPEASVTEYTIQKGDTYSTIAPKFHVTVSALQKANPTVDPARLQIGKKINIPAATATTPTATSGATIVDTASGMTTYTVKSGDTLSKLATDFHTTVKAIQAANGLKDTRIKVGDKLKIPAK